MPLPSAYPVGVLLGAPAPLDTDTPSRCLFSWDADDAALVSRAGDVGTFARASIGTYVDSAGALRTAPANIPRFTALDLDGDGVREALGLLLERAATNRVPWSTPTAAHWASDASGNTTFAAGVLSLGDVSGTEVRAAAGAASEAHVACGVLPADGTLGVAWIVAPSAGADPAGSRLALVDTDAPADRCALLVTWDATGAPVVVATAGAFLGAVPLAGGAWRLCAQAVGVLHAHAHRVSIVPNASGTAPGALTVAHVQVDDTPYPTSAILTSGAATARAADACTFPVAWRPQACTLVVALARPVWAGLPGLEHVPLTVGTPGSAGAATLTDAGAGQCGASRSDGGTVLAAAAPLPAATRGLARERLVWSAAVNGWADRPTAARVVVTSDAGQATSAGAAAGAPLASTWAPATVDLCLAGHEPDAVLLAARIAPGVRPLRVVRGLR